jgi:ParB family transcriptional regulator, chromosome partitioning protein
VSAKRSLGRGLDALLPKVEKERTAQQLPLGELSVSAFQPRKRFDPESVAELARSVAQKGVLQPLLVRPSGDGYEIVAGERRFRAAQQAGLSTVPVVVKTLSDRETLEIALIENVQREDLSAVEEARAFKQLLEFGLSQEEVAEAVGKSRSAVANTLRLLQLDDAALGALDEGAITAGHARAILAQPEADRAWALEKILEGQLSVRQAEGLKRTLKPEQAVKKGLKADTLRDLELNLSRTVGTKVRVSGDKKGKIELHFGSRDELERLLELLNYSA